MKTLIFKIFCLLVCLTVFEAKSLEYFDDSPSCKTKECVLFSSIMDNLIYPSNPVCKNFFDFACGKFVKSTIVHDRYGEQGFQTEITEKAEEKIRKLLASPITDSDIRPFRLAKQTYKMCINHDQLNEDGAKPMYDLIAKLGSWGLISKGLHIPERTWQEMYENNLANGFILDTFMSIYLVTNPKNNSNYIVKITPPSKEDFNRAYYEVLPQGINNTLVNAYYTYMKNYTILVGADPKDAEEEMLKVLQLEQKMFEIVKRKNPNGKPETKLITLKELQEIFPFIQWKRFIEIYLGQGFKLDENDFVSLTDDFYFQNIIELIKDTDLRVMENYFFWRVIDHSKFYLAVKFKEPALKYQEAVYGRFTYEQQWKRCVSQLKNLLGTAIKAMTARSENEGNLDDIKTIIENVKLQVIETMKKIPMNETFKTNLLEKISSYEVYVGYPKEFFMDEPLEEFYSDLEIFEGEFFKTAINLEVFSMRSYGRMILKPKKETIWQDSSNFPRSYFSTVQKTFFIHPNDLKAPIYNPKLPSYINYARFGYQVANLYAIAISIEFDGKNVTWYDEINNHIKNQYQDYVAQTYNMTIDGSKALRNNFADFLSFEFAYQAMKHELENLTEKPLRLPGLHFSLEQLFWISAMQRYCQVNKDQETLQKLVLGSYPIESYRANNPLKNNFDFARDFGCMNGEKDGNHLYPRSFPEKNNREKIKLSLFLFAFCLAPIFI